jgi:alpha-tubulin suppressor-like RCC1 family protein
MHRDPDVRAVVIGGRTWVQIGSGAGHTCGMATDGLLYCWGDNGEGQVGVNDPLIGQGGQIPVLTPTVVVGQQ